MAKYCVLDEDFPTEKYDWVMQLFRYNSKEEYLTMEHRWVNRLSNKDVSRKTADSKFEYEEIATNKPDIRKLRDFLNSLDLDEKIEENEEKLCFGCGDKLGAINFHDIFSDGEEFDACPSCTGLYFEEIPEQIKLIKINRMKKYG